MKLCSGSTLTEIPVRQIYNGMDKLTKKQKNILGRMARGEALVVLDWKPCLLRVERHTWRSVNKTGEFTYYGSFQQVTRKDFERLFHEDLIRDIDPPRPSSDSYPWMWITSKGADQVRIDRNGFDVTTAGMISYSSIPEDVDSVTEFHVPDNWFSCEIFGQQSNTKKNTAMIKIFQDEKGDTAITTDAEDERAFLDDLSVALIEDIATRKNSIDTTRKLLSQIIDICCKYRGYKNNVTEKRVLTVGNILMGDPIVDLEGNEKAPDSEAEKSVSTNGTP